MNSFIKYCSIIVLSGLIFWIARGAYDKIFIFNGEVHLINTTETIADIRCEFPSGKEIAKKLTPGESARFFVGNTGEGSIGVYTNDELLNQVGYVTSHNPLIIITITKEKAHFFHVTQCK